MYLLTIDAKMKMKLLFLFCASVIASAEESLKLEQVIILSRHSVRTPLSKYLAAMTPKDWPKWKEKSGYLTAKGYQVEGLMGQYFSMWFKKEGLISGCPTEDDFLAYANTKQRTLASAQAFVSKSFPGCKVTVHHSNTTMDPVFNPVIHNNSEIFKELAINQMKNCLKSIHLNSSFDCMDKLLDYKHSSLCIDYKKCNLSTDSNKIVDVKQGFKPNLSGPLKIANSAIDAFIMENYEGFEQKEVAWGEMTEDKWKTIMKLSREYHNVIFNTTLLAGDIAHPLIRYISKTCKDGPKITLLMGHDANIYTILKALKFKPYALRKQNEITPVGGKILFEKLFDEKSETYLLRLTYVYQSTDQLRNAIELSLHNPPQFHVLELEECPYVIDGFCLWDDFVKILEKFDTFEI